MMGKVINVQMDEDFYNEIIQGGGSSSGSRWTGHADVEGLKAIGWTDEDIAYYQTNGVNWNEEDDQYHKVPEDNIALYGVLTADNIQEYKDRIVYLPKIDTSGMTSMNNMFTACFCLVSIPLLDTSKITTMHSMFTACLSLVSIPQLDTSNVSDMDEMFTACSSLVSIPQLDTSNARYMSGMFSNCSSLVSIPKLDTSKVSGMSGMFSNCSSLVSIPQLDASNVNYTSDMFLSCSSLQTIKFKNLGIGCYIKDTSLLTKDSLLYIINQSAGTKFTIYLSSYCYNKYSNDADVVAALANHPNISLAQ